MKSYGRKRKKTYGRKRGFKKYSRKSRSKKRAAKPINSRGGIRL